MFGVVKILNPKKLDKETPFNLLCHIIHFKNTGSSMIILGNGNSVGAGIRPIKGFTTSGSFASNPNFGKTGQQKIKENCRETSMQFQPFQWCTISTHHNQNIKNEKKTERQNQNPPKFSFISCRSRYNCRKNGRGGSRCQHKLVNGERELN